MFQVLSSTLMTPPGFKYFTAVKETDVRKRWRWRRLLWRSTWKRDHVTDTSEVRSHVGLRDTGEKVWTQKCWSQMIHFRFSRLFEAESLFLCLFSVFVVCGLRDRRSHIFILVRVVVWRWKCARISPLSPAEFCIRFAFLGTGSGWMAVIYVSALRGVKVKISSDESGWRNSELWTLTATWTCS